MAVGSRAAQRTGARAGSGAAALPHVHRWRKLEGSDPATYEMIQKIQTLQKRLIPKTEEVVEKDLLIQEKEKLYVELKNILARQPGPEVAEQLSVYQQNLKEKTRQMKAMASELNMYQAQVNEYKYEIERVTLSSARTWSSWMCPPHQSPQADRRRDARRGAASEVARGCTPAPSARRTRSARSRRVLRRRSSPSASSSSRRGSRRARS